MSDTALYNLIISWFSVLSSTDSISLNGIETSALFSSVPEILKSTKFFNSAPVSCPVDFNILSDMVSLTYLQSGTWCSMKLSVSNINVICLSDKLSFSLKVNRYENLMPSLSLLISYFTVLSVGSVCTTSYGVTVLFSVICMRTGGFSLVYSTSSPGFSAALAVSQIFAFPPSESTAVNDHALSAACICFSSLFKPASASYVNSFS